MPHGWTDSELLREVIDVPRRAFVPLPDTQIIERPGWLQLVTPSLRQGGLNEVSLAVLDEAEADAVSDETIDLYRRLGLWFRWTVGPDSRPVDLAERLARRGLRQSEVHGMLRETAPAPAGDAEDVTVEEVNEGTVAEFTRTMAEGWHMDPGPLEAYNRSILAQPGGRHRLFLARHRGVPAGTASLAAFERSTYLVGAVVLPAMRGRGLYRALVTARLHYAAERGVPFAVSLARASSSAPILERLGFKTLCRFQSFSKD